MQQGNGEVILIRGEGDFLAWFPPNSTCLSRHFQAVVGLKHVDDLGQGAVDAEFVGSKAIMAGDQLLRLQIVKAVTCSPEL